MAEDRSGVKSLNLALDVLEVIATAEEDMGVTEVAARLGLTKATVYRHLQTLVERDYLAQDSRNARYRLGVQCQLLGQLSGNRIDLRSASEEVSRWLREKTGLSVVVSALRARSVLVLTTLAAKSPIQIQVRPGSDLPLQTSAQGRVALAFGRPSLVSYARRQNWEMSTPYTLRDWNALEEKIVQTRLRGWGDAPEELALGLNAIAAPIFDDSEECVGTIAVVGLIQSLPREASAAVTGPLLEAAQRVSLNLGHQPEAVAAG
ncbi:IclR family transcriptional regulator [Novosphingobium profundi]|uniref:IclR family transcriptional regulator n=1 Tax=Novosphingobium profundi TaxID=1774954 RepID=UPI001BDB15B2|nr:IclR family transcriptional regulator [Novosphingobium profundi]MBT0668133.1 IclR family transcriptional regulator [Novosphingobium profundi]